MIGDDGRGMVRREFMRRAGAGGMALGMSGMLAACGKDSNPSPNGGVLSVGSKDFLPPDFYIGNSLGGHLVGWSQMAWALFMGGGGNGKGFELQNGLASGYEVSPDLLDHTVTLRDGLSFHDGSPIDADAVAQNLRAAFFKDSPLRDRGPYIGVLITLGDPPVVRSVEAQNPRTVRIRLTQPRNDITVALSFLPIINPRVMRNKNYGVEPRALRDAGSGPFRLTRYEPGSFAEFERFKGFFEDVVPDRVRIQQFTDEGAISLALRGGEIAVASGLAKSDYEALSGSGFESIVSDPVTNVDFLFEGPEDETFADKRVRQAMELAMNREAYTERFLPAGTAELSSQPIIPPNLGGYDEGLKPAPYDPDAARALMAEAGVRSAKLTAVVPPSLAPISSSAGLLEAIAGDVAKVGIEIDIDRVDQTTFTNEKTSFEAYAEVLVGQADPLPSFGVYVGDRPPENFAAIPSIQKPLEEAYAATDPKRRDALLSRIQRTIREEAIMIPISVVGLSVLAASSVENFPLSGTLLDSWHQVSVGT